MIARKIWKKQMPNIGHEIDWIVYNQLNSRFFFLGKSYFCFLVFLGVFFFCRNKNHQQSVYTILKIKNDCNFFKRTFWIMGIHTIIFSCLCFILFYGFYDDSLWCAPWSFLWTFPCLMLSIRDSCLFAASISAEDLSFDTRSTITSSSM